MSVTELGHFKETVATPEWLKPDVEIIFDLDGIVGRWAGHASPDQRAQGKFFDHLGEFRKRNVGISVLTNRPPGAMAFLAYQFGGKENNGGIWVTESGGSAYDPLLHKSWVFPEYIDFAGNEVPEARLFLENHLGITGYRRIPHSPSEAQFEPGMGQVKTVIVSPEGMSPKEYYKEILLPAWENYTGRDAFNISVGKGIDIDPKGLDKKNGLEHLLRINSIDPNITPTLFIADANRDIGAARELFRLGGYVGAVGNSSADFISAVGSNPHGIIAPESTQYHSSATWILQQFLAQIA